ncbi:hypothetical protein EVAR_70969_1 [Eumeta japonica]|uniref:Uncharacterized protein n=1 Tax=Eumeta variegata TaxID=151549 RepID=A0A4C1SNG5_EUMVA|nr:hypothetical protein EVAR_70969_1 [Eumeta japonica]
MLPVLGTVNIQCDDSVVIEKSAYNAREAYSRPQVFSRDKRVCGPPGSKWSPPPMDTCKPRGVTSALPAFLKEVRAFRVFDPLEIPSMDASHEDFGDGISGEQNDNANQRQERGIINFIIHNLAWQVAYPARQNARAGAATSRPYPVRL